MNAEKLSGIALTDSMAMMPAAAVSALCFANKEAAYFAVGKVSKDQVKEYASRKKQDFDVTEKDLSELLAYDSV